MGNGLYILADIESFNYAYYPRGAKGMMVALSDPRDRAIVSQNGKYS